MSPTHQPSKCSHAVPPWRKRPETTSITTAKTMMPSCDWSSLYCSSVRRASGAGNNHAISASLNRKAAREPGKIQANPSKATK
ncbi:MAG: hypothetical protein QM796_07655 [Chthoniobacteraceae bacterium]